MRSYLPSLQGRNKLRTLKTNLVRGGLVLEGDSKNLRHKGAYWLGRIHCLHPHTRKGSEIVRRATVAVIGKSTAAADRVRLNISCGIYQR